MDLNAIIDALILGIVEGVTEFIPVSSTAHLLLSARMLGFDSGGGAFEVLIQLGAILALVAVYAARLWQLVIDLPRDPASRRFALGVVLAFLPSAILGVLFHHLITQVFFQSVGLISIALIVGGVALLALDRMTLRPRYSDIMQFPLRLAFGIGLFQCLSLVPGVWRSGAANAGALLLGTVKRSAAEYSFFLAMPTMAGAFAYDLYKNIDSIDGSAALLIAVGFVVAFLSALVVVRGFLGFVSRHGFAPFAYWRIVVGVAGLIAVIFFGVGGTPNSVVVQSDRTLPVELAARAEAVEIARQDRFQAGGFYAETPQRAPIPLRLSGHDVVHL
jgi:undecaprenyl-diphosphatase